MFEILAFAPEDGWAFVKADTRIHLVRPPYTLNSSSIVPAESVQVAIAQHGFVQPRDGERHFESWHKLLESLSQKMVAARKARNEEVIDAAGEDLLDLAPEDVLSQFLDRISAELLPAGNWDHAEKLLLQMLKMPRFAAYAELHQRAVELLMILRESRSKKAEIRQRFAVGIRNNATFSNAFSLYGQEEIESLSTEIASRGTVFSFSGTP